MRKKNIDIYPYNELPRFKRKGTVLGIETYLERFYERGCVLLSSGHIGIYYFLLFHKIRRSDDILIPDFLCQIILNILNTSSFPVKCIDKRTKAILLYHQWGYPQKMDVVLPEAKKRNLLVIEDCAHSFDSTFQGKRVGTFGDAAIFSFSKMSPTGTTGFLVSSNSEFLEYVRQDKQKKNTLYNVLFSRFNFLIARKYYKKIKTHGWWNQVYVKSIEFPQVDKKSLALCPPTEYDFFAMLDARKKNYLFLKNNVNATYLIPDLEENIDVNPLCIPIFLPPEKLEAARQALLQKGVECDILHFDINRNMFDSLYKKCLAVPCHPYISVEVLADIVACINTV